MWILCNLKLLCLMQGTQFVQGVSSDICVPTLQFCLPVLQKHHHAGGKWGTPETTAPTDLGSHRLAARYQSQGRTVSIRQLPEDLLHHPLPVHMPSLLFQMKLGGRTTALSQIFEGS